MTLKYLNDLVSRTNLLSSIQKIPMWNDDPAFVRFNTHLNKDVYNGDGLFETSGSGGCSLYPEIALKKAIFEGLERYSQSYFKFSDFLHDTFSNVSKKNAALAPDTFCYFTKEQLAEKNFENFSFSKQTKFYWTDCKNVFDEQSFFIPAQMVYSPYKYVDEKNICLPISTGTALGFSKDEALYKGLCEVIERDAFITSYLLSIPPKKIVFTGMTKKIKTYFKLFDDYNLKVESFLLTSDLDVPTVMSVIFDTNSTTPAISIGLKTDLDLEKAILGSLDEAFQLRSWIRRCLITQNFRGETYMDRILLKRALFWSNPRNTHFLDFLLNGNQTISFSRKEMLENKKLEYSEKANKVKEILKVHNLQAYYKDITHPSLIAEKIHVIKAFVPYLQPLFIDEEYPYYGGKRIEKLRKEYHVEHLNLIIHPFL